MWRGGVQILENEEEDARLLDRCEAKRTELSKHWQCDVEVQSMQDMPWRNEELRKGEEALSRLYKAKNRSGMRRIPHQSSPWT